MILYGIPNCDTVKKARAFLADHGVEYRFHDYKKQGVDGPVIASMIRNHGWETIINRRGTTWRKLDDALKASMDAEKAVQLAMDEPSVIKRPIMVRGHDSLVGFDVQKWQEFFLSIP